MTDRPRQYGSACDVISAGSGKMGRFWEEVNA